MDFVKLEAWPRTAGKGHNTQLRREGKIPAVSYGQGVSSRSLALSPKALVAALQGPFGRNVVLEVAIGQEPPFPALVSDYSYHPLTRELQHVDLLHIDLDKPVDIDVPLRCIGKAAGVVEGGVLRQVFRTLPLRCLPSLTPAFLEYDVTEMNQGDSVKTTGINVPEGVSIRLPAEQTIIAIVAPEAEKAEEAEAGAVPAEGAAAAEGAAPAAGAAAPAAGAAAKAAPAKGAAAKDDKKDKGKK
jgi:large subunit ribosomal protein L25